MLKVLQKHAQAKIVSNPLFIRIP